jgi:glycosyltransferase involved in cell wall biosynthesis
MNHALAQCVVESLRVTGPFEESLVRLGTFSRRDWEHTLPWLDDSGLALYLLDRVNRSGLREVLPIEIETRLGGNLDSNRRRLAKMKEEFESLNRRFEAAGVEYAVLKGFALIPDYCPDAVLRSQYDYDYLVAEGSLAKAQQVLEAADYSQKIQSPGFEKTGASLFAAGSLHVSAPDKDFYTGDISRTVELHLSLWEPNRDGITLETPADSMDRKTPATWEGLGFPVLADEDALIFQALHAFQHTLDYWCRPSCFLEIGFFIARRRSDSDFWERFRSRLEGRKRLFEIVSLVFAMAASLFKAPIPTEVCAWTTERLSAALCLWVQRHGWNWALARFPGSKLSLLAHRQFIEDADLWKQVMLSRLFPIHRPAKVVEPENPTLSSRTLATWGQWRFIWSRLRFHVGGFLGYAWELPRWKLVLHRLAKSTKLPILFLNQQSWRAGAERVLDEAIRAVETDFLPIVAFPDDGPFAANLRSRKVETLIFPLGRYRSGPKSLADMIAFPPRSVYCGFRLAQVIRRRKISLVYINSPRWLLAGVIAARLTGRPSIYHLHMTLRRRADIFAAAHTARHVTKILACSQTSARSLARGDPSLVRIMQVVYNPVRRSASGVSLAFRNEASPAHLHNSGSSVVGVVGRISPHKGQGVVLQAVGRLIKQGLNVRAIFVGAPDPHSAEDCAYLRTLQSSTRASGLHDRFYWPGYQDDPNPFYRVFDVLVIPSTVSEGLPMVALEALQCGVPVIGSRVGGIPEVVHHGINGFLVPPGDEEALAESLARLMSDPEVRARLRVGACATVDDRFSVATFQRAIRNAIVELCPPSPGAAQTLEPCSNPRSIAATDCNSRR